MINKNDVINLLLTLFKSNITNDNELEWNRSLYNAINAVNSIEETDRFCACSTDFPLYNDSSNTYDNYYIVNVINNETNNTYRRIALLDKDGFCVTSSEKVISWMSINSI